MKKHVVRGALLGLCALPLMASAQVKLYGTLDTFLGSIKKSGDLDSTQQLGSGGMTTSYFGLSGQEDLGSNTKAIFALEGFIRMDTGAQGRVDSDPLFSRNAWLGVQGDWGTVKAGRNGNQTYLGMLRQSAFGLSFNFSPLVLQTFSAPFNGAILGDTVWNNSLEYTSPTFNGLKASAMVALGEDTNRSGANNYGAHVNYNHDRWNVQVSAQRVRVDKITTLENSQTTVLVGASYRFDALTLHGNYVNVDTKDTPKGVKRGIERDTYDLGVTVPLATGKVMAEIAYTDSDNDRDATGRDYERTTASIGYLYPFSKRTDTYVNYMYDKKNSLGSASSFGVGIRHNF